MIEERCGLPLAILITGRVFAIVHLNFTPILWPYCVALAAVYGVMTSRTNSILPAMVLHTLDNMYSSLHLWLWGNAEWQATAGAPSRSWDSGASIALASLIAAGVAMGVGFSKLSESVSVDSSHETGRNLFFRIDRPQQTHPYRRHRKITRAARNFLRSQCACCHGGVGCHLPDQTMRSAFLRTGGVGTAHFRPSGKRPTTSTNN